MERMWNEDVEYHSTRKISSATGFARRREGRQTSKKIGTAKVNHEKFDTCRTGEFSGLYASRMCNRR